jgi:anthranilate synthase/aminodeoxychorismate synthase-like glutamine amidotransferase
MILLIDNYDSFVYNLARYVRELGHEAIVRRHDALALDDIASLAPSHIILSPGPCTPAEAGISTDVVRRFGPSIPILGVCLGHQCIGAAYGARIVRAGRPMHGKVSQVTHDGLGIFTGLPSPFHATRYHSLVIAPDSVPDALRVTARSEDGEIMAVAHRDQPTIGVQFHPESALTEYGYFLLGAFLDGPGAHYGAGATLPDRADGRRAAYDAAAAVSRDPPYGGDGGPPLDEAPPPVSVVR